MENSKVIFLYCCKQSTELSHLQGGQIPSKQLMIAFIRIKLYIPVSNLGFSFPSG